MKKLRGLLLVFMVIGVIFVGTGCGQQSNNGVQSTAQPTAQSTAQLTTQPTTQASAQSTASATEQATAQPENVVPKNMKAYKVQIEMADGGKMVFQMMPQYAPKTVENFVKLVKEGLFDGLKFHRIMKEFMVQGGDSSSAPSKRSMPQSIVGEFASNGFTQNTLKHTKGVISMARTTDDPNSATSQFFIITGEAGFLDNNYAAFGKLISGQETLDKIANTPVVASANGGEVSTPTVDVVMKKVTLI